MAASTAELRAYKPVTPFGAMALVADRAAASSSAVEWPSPRWAKGPVGFAREVLGIELWEGQIKIVESIRDNRNTTCRSGHKCGKTTAIAVAALWFWATFVGARVMCTAVTHEQVENVIWKEIRRLHRRSESPVGSVDDDTRTVMIPLGGRLNESARAGLKHEDGRQLWGATARKGEGLAGISGANVLILFDEASGIEDDYFETLGTSLGGDGGTVRKCYISNPTRTSGEFYRSHMFAGSTFNRIHISSEDTPNARGEKIIKGLAGREWIRERRAEWGEDSFVYAVRVKGNFAHDASATSISLDAIALAQVRWHTTADEGSLQIGIDPAGETETGDETAFAVRRGNRIVTVLGERGLSEDEIKVRVLDILREYRRPTDHRVRVVIDRGGIGNRVFEKLNAHLDVVPNAYELEGINGGHVMWRSSEFHKFRDGLWGIAARWINKAKGAIPDDARLSQDLHTVVLKPDENGRQRATDKDEFRKKLRRSPDRGDAVCLAIWGFEGEASSDEAAAAARGSAPAQTNRVVFDDASALPTMNPYDALRVWQRR